METIKVLIADEDVLVRQAVASIIQDDPGADIRVSGDMEHIEELVEKIAPDIVLLSLDDAHQNGFTLLNTLRLRFPFLPLVVLTQRNEEGAVLAMYALRHGASDVITKPEKNRHLLFAGRHLVKRLKPTVKALCQLAGSGYGESSSVSHSKTMSGQWQGDTAAGPADRRENPAGLVTIGASLGGPSALFSLLPALPEDLAVPVVIVQHLPKYYTRELARTLDAISHLPVEEAWDGAELKPGTVWVAPGGFHAEVYREGSRSWIKLHRGPRENGVRPSIDLLFRSASRSFGSGVLGILLSGCGIDGLAGADSIIENGGQLIIQDPRTALAPELPLAAIQSGLTRSFYSPEQLGDQIIKRTSKSEKPEIRRCKKGISEYSEGGRGDYMSFTSL